jgi:hypothetical protein
MLLDALVVRYFTGNIVRSLTAVLSIVFAVAVVTTAFVINSALLALLGSSAIALDPGVQLEILGISDRVPDSLLAVARRTPGVTEARPIVVGTAYLGEHDSVAAQLVGTDLLNALPNGLSAAVKWPTQYDGFR